MKYFTKHKWTYFLLIPIAAILFTLLWMLLDSQGLKESSIGKRLIIGIMDTSAIWLGCMAIVTFFWFKFPWEKKPIPHLFLEIPSILIYTVLISYLLFTFYKSTGLVDRDAMVTSTDIFISMLITLLITTIHEAVLFYKLWVKNFSKSVRLEKENINAKYETLKAQINPHFLFNSLNSLVTLVDDNPKATGYIMDLSDFLRYMLKSREREVVLLREETEVLNKYVNLQKTRFGENLKINLKIDEKFFHYALPPLVLQMLVENCIKHNIISKSNPLVIDIYVKNENVIIENTLQKKEDVISTGNGLRNIEERYSYLTAKKIEISQTNGKFTVSVPIVLVDL